MKRLAFKKGLPRFVVFIIWDEVACPSLSAGEGIAGADGEKKRVEEKTEEGEGRKGEWEDSGSGGEEKKRDGSGGNCSAVVGPYKTANYLDVIGAAILMMTVNAATIPREEAQLRSRLALDSAKDITHLEWDFLIFKMKYRRFCLVTSRYNLSKFFHSSLPMNIMFSLGSDFWHSTDMPGTSPRYKPLEPHDIRPSKYSPLFI
ncbi:hypothetical protein D9615_000057 [Tricholomella constricta]|uniref:Uncharacterized protein n=1 Tax=Tricholomella constricta TaxID=117010 RepID=A0A8H5HRM7_9AGAR|nr:hypothetical protein D9615_000057 [Tricholomella constricta]